MMLPGAPQQRTVTCQQESVPCYQTESQAFCLMPAAAAERHPDCTALVLCRVICPGSQCLGFAPGHSAWALPRVTVPGLCPWSQCLGFAPGHSAWTLPLVTVPELCPGALRYGKAPSLRKGTWSDTGICAWTVVLWPVTAAVTSFSWRRQKRA